VQYGLEALRRQQISMAEFLNLNDNIGGWKPAVDMKPERFWRSGGAQSHLADISVWSHQNMTTTASANRPAPRSEGDVAAIEAAYRSGQVFLGELTMPIIDVRHYLEPELDMHHSAESISARLRLLRQQGHADNQLIWSARLPNAPQADALALLERWIENMRGSSSLGAGEARPADASDRCYDESGQIIASGNRVWNGAWNGEENGECMNVYPIYSNPRHVAGDDYAGDIMKCHLQPVDAAIEKGLYAPIDVSGHRGDLRRVFPSGVCDYSLGDVGRPDGLLSK